MATTPGAAPTPFEILCEIEPATGPDLTRVRRQIALLTGAVDAFLVPDNHLGRATVSSIAVAREVAALGGSAMACVNSRDRNLLGFRRDLLTAAAYGVDRFLFVRGDDGPDGARSGDLTVRRMIDEAHAYEHARFAAGVTVRVGSALPAWKQAADFCVAQVTYDLDRLLAWRDTLTYDGAVYAGLMVLASSSMARRIAADIAEIDVPDQLVDALERDRDAGVEHALTMLDAIQASGAFDGVHLVPVSRYEQVAAGLHRRRRG